MNQGDAMSVDQVFCAWCLQQEVAVWMVQEDDHGRWRKFPPHLNAVAERMYVEWKLGFSPNNVMEYQWQNAAQTKSVTYEITFHDMLQKNMSTNKVRAVERYVRFQGKVASLRLVVR